MEALLKDLKVLDFTNNIAGPACGSLLAEHGADVIHIEKPVWGDDCRNFPPMMDGTSTIHMAMNKGKRSLVLDLKDPKAVEIAKRMVRDADVLIESARPGAMDRLGLGYEDLKILNPRLIYCSISAFGQEGPYAGKAGYDVIAQAFSGFMYYTGEPDGGPTKITGAIGDFSTGMNAYGQIMTALFYRERTGKGQRIDVNLARTLLWMNGTFDHLYTGRKRARTGNQDMSLCPYGIFTGKNDEYIVIGAVNVRLWQQLCRAMDREDLIDDPRFLTNDKRVEHQKEVIALIEEWLRSFDTVKEASRVLDGYGIPNCKLYTMDDILEDPHVREMGWLKEVPTCDSVSSFPSRLSPVGLADLTEAEIRVSPAPDLGQHNKEILQEYGLSEEEIEEMEVRWAKN